MSQLNQYMPALGNSRSTSYNHAQMSKDLQVYHLTSNHHPNQIYSSISPSYVHSIQLKDNPSMLYNSKMKNLYMEELDASLNREKLRIMKQNKENQEFKKQYRQNVNAMILSMENHSNKMKQQLNNRFQRQKIRQARFVDADKIRINRIQSFINNNDQNHLYNKSKILYEKQLQEKYMSKNMQNNEKYTQYYTQRQSFQNNPSTFKDTPIQSQNCQTIPINIKQIEQRRYSCHKNNKNQSCVLPKLNSTPLSKIDPNRRILRIHNPITNPLQYQVSNPYFIKGIQAKDRKQRKFSIQKI